MSALPCVVGRGNFRAMHTKLIVASGKSAGRAIAIKRNTLLIGRAEECDVRPLSEDVSRRHCAITSARPRSGSRISAAATARSSTACGSRRRRRSSTATSSGSGAFELKVSCTKPAAQGAEDDVSSWLMADDAPAGMFDTTQSLRTGAGRRRTTPPTREASNIHASPPTDGGRVWHHGGRSSPSGSRRSRAAVWRSRP